MRYRIIVSVALLVVLCVASGCSSNSSNPAPTTTELQDFKGTSPTPQLIQSTMAQNRANFIKLHPDMAKQAGTMPTVAGATPSTPPAQ